MNIHNLVLGDYQTNSFVLTGYESAPDCVIIDTGLGSEPLLQYLQQNDLKPAILILTHGHADHIAGINLLRQAHSDMKVAIHKLDADMLGDSIANLSAMGGSFFKAEPADILIETEEMLDFAGISLQVLHTPGHTPGGISLYSQIDSVVFSGDALFADSIGRTDFPGGDFDTLIKGIKQKLLTLPGKTKVYTGHGPATTIEKETSHNQFLA